MLETIKRTNKLFFANKKLNGIDDSDALHLKFTQIIMHNQIYLAEK